MDLIAFLPPAPSPADQRPPLDLAASWKAGQVETYDTLEALTQRLSHPRHDSFLLVLWAPSQPYLDRLLALRDLMAGVPIICVLPDDQPGTMAKGHLMRPRLLLSQAEAADVISEVLRKFQMKVTQRR